MTFNKSASAIHERRYTKTMQQTSTALLTDHYELTMIDAALAEGTAHRDSVFELFTRRLPKNRTYGVVAGTGRFLEALENFRFRDDELEWLKERDFLHQRTLDWLANYRFSGDIWGYPEGEVFFPNSPLLIIESTFAEAVILETLALSTLNYDSAVATAAARMVTAAEGKPLAEMGSRRTGERSAVAAARAAYVAGFSATSNLEAGRTYGIPTMGTAAHSFTLLHDGERHAFQAQIDALGTDTTLLIDTYNIESGVKNAIEIAGPELGGVRIDSGDLPVVVRQVRKQLDDLGAHHTKITVTNDLDEYNVAALAESPVDSFGVGTSVVTGSGSSTMGMVYKLVARTDGEGRWVSVAKASSGKASVGGKKYVRREYNAHGKATAESIIVGVSPDDADHAPQSNQESRKILVPLVTNGEVNAEHVGTAGIEAARKRLPGSIAELPTVALSLSRSEAIIPTEYVHTEPDKESPSYAD